MAERTGVLDVSDCVSVLLCWARSWRVWKLCGEYDLKFLRTFAIR